MASQANPFAQKNWSPPDGREHVHCFLCGFPCLVSQKHPAIHRIPLTDPTDCRLVRYKFKKTLIHEECHRGEGPQNLARYW